MMRNMARVGLGVIVVLAVAWGGLWWYTEGRLHDMLATSANMQNTSDGNDTVSYDSISKGTNPLTASATLNNFHLNVRPPGGDAQSAVSIAQITAWIDVFNPLVMHVGLSNRIDINTPKGVVSITFGSMSNSASLDPRALWNHKIYPITGETIAVHDIDALAGGGNFAVLHIDDIAGQVQVNAGAGANETASTAAYTIDGIALPPALVLMGHVPFSGKIAHIGVGYTFSGPFDWSSLRQQLRAPQLSMQDRNRIIAQAGQKWAASGGTAKANLTLALGPSTLNAGGNVAFDADAQPNGTADVSADHLDAFTTALTTAYPQLQQSIGNMEAQLSPYLTTIDAGGQMLNVHVAYGKPGVLVNGTKKADMPPLDWAKLENPPAPPAPASGDGSGAATTAP